MLLKLNSGLAAAILCLYALGFLVGAPVIHVVQLHTSGMSSITPDGQWIYSIYFVLKYLDHIIVAFWLLTNASHFREDALTWTLCGMAFGFFAIPLFIAVITFKRSYNLKFRSSLSTLMLLLLAYFVTAYVAFALFGDESLITLPNQWKIDPLASKIMLFYFGALMFIMNVVLAVFILKILKGKDRSWIWGLSTLVMGPLPATIKIFSLIYFRKKISVREMSSVL